jgi:hypothetical protein
MGARHILSVDVHLKMIECESTPEQNVHDRKTFPAMGNVKKTLLMAGKMFPFLKAGFSIPGNAFQT